MTKVTKDLGQIQFLLWGELFTIEWWGTLTDALPFTVLRLPRGHSASNTALVT